MISKSLIKKVNITEGPFIDIIMPNYNKLGFAFTLTDIIPFIAIGSLFFAFFFRRLKKHSLIPIKDPRLSEGLNFENF